ncbi:MAG: hypothetical protein IKU19_04730, partial [Clostridia bacterium]|nr:hypothetical protein [Clostridia bacterium]
DNVTPEFAAIEGSFASCTDCLSQNQLFYHYGDETLMAKYGRVEGNKIIIGNCTYDKVVLPLTHTIDKSTADLLKEYLANGGRLALYGDTLPEYIEGRKADISWLVPNCSIGDFCNENEITVRYDGAEALDIRVQSRRVDGKRLYYVLNLSHKLEHNNVEFNIKGIEHMSILDMATLEAKGIDTEKTAEGIKFTLDFEKVQSYILFEEKCEVVPKKDMTKAEHTPFKISEDIENSFTLDYARISYDGKEYSDVRPIVRIKDNLLSERYEGKLWVKFEFDLKSVPSKLSCAIEKLASQKVYVNGTEITLGDDWWLDRHIAAVSITELLKEGMNEIVCEIDYFQRDYVYYVLYGGVSESLRNCLCFDTEIESIYLFGDFEVNTESDKFEYHPHDYIAYTGGFSIKKSEGSIDLANITESGYPFLTGSIMLEAEYTGGGKELWLEGSYVCADIYINDQLHDKLLFNQHCTLDGIKPGDKIGVRLYTSNLNLLGVHHHIDVEVIASPDTFSLEKQWDGDKCALFTDRYAFKKFGLNKE